QSAAVRSRGSSCARCNCSYRSIADTRTGDAVECIRSLLLIESLLRPKVAPISAVLLPWRFSRNSHRTSLIVHGLFFLSSTTPSKHRRLVPPSGDSFALAPSKQLKVRPRREQLHALVELLGLARMLAPPRHDQFAHILAQPLR